jgi:hypothetical protein
VPVNETTVDTINIANLKTIAEAGAHSMGLAMQNAVSHQQAMNQVSLAGVGAMVKRLVEVDVNEAAGIAPLLQQLAKVAQTTPPPTA